MHLRQRLGRVLLASVPAVLLFGAAPAGAAIRPEKVHVADAKKTEAYIRDGLIVGGDHAIDDVVVRDIRRAANAGFERVVIDLEGNRGGEPAAISRPPYYQLAVNPEERRLVLTVFGKPKLAFDAKKVQQAFRKSRLVSGVELFPRLDEDSWTLVLGLKATQPVEVFELGNPVRIILDIKSAATTASARKAVARKKLPARRAHVAPPAALHPAPGEGGPSAHGDDDEGPTPGPTPGMDAPPETETGTAGDGGEG